MCRHHTRSPERATPTARGKTPPQAGCRADPAKNNLVEKPLPTVATNREQGKGGGRARASPPPPAGEDFPRVTLRAGLEPRDQGPTLSPHPAAPRILQEAAFRRGTPSCLLPKDSCPLKEENVDGGQLWNRACREECSSRWGLSFRLQADTWSYVSGRGLP